MRKGGGREEEESVEWDEKGGEAPRKGGREGGKKVISEGSDPFSLSKPLE